MPLAEECGLIRAVGEWTLERALSQAGAWQRALPGTSSGSRSTSRRRSSRRATPTSRSCKSSCASNQLDGRAARARGHRARADVGPRRERRDAARRSASSACASPSTTSAPATRASPTCASLPIDKLKIDRSFLRAIDSQAADEAIVRAIAALATTLGIAVAGRGRGERGAARAPARARLRGVAGALLQRAARRRRLRGAHLRVLLGAHRAQLGRLNQALGRGVRRGGLASGASTSWQPVLATSDAAFQSRRFVLDSPSGCRSPGCAPGSGCTMRGVDLRILLAAVADQDELELRVGAQDVLDRLALVVLVRAKDRSRAA